MADRNGISLEALGVGLPYSIEAEQAVLGAILTDSSTLYEVMEILGSEHFYHRQNAEIFREIVRMFVSGEPIDFVTVLNTSVGSGIFQNEDDAKVYLYSLTQTVPTVTNVVSYAKIVYDKYLMRSLIGVSKEIMDRSGETQEGASSLLDYAEQRIYDIRNGKSSNGIKAIDTVLIETLEQLNRLNGPDRAKYLGIPTGFVHLDRTLTGLNRSDLIILAARPGVGKTSFALNIATNIAKSSDKSVVIFSLEMTTGQLASRILSSESGVVSQAFRTGEIKPDEWVSIAQSSDIISKSNLYLDDSSGISVSEIKAKARRVNNLGLIIVDYLQLMSGNSRTESRVQEISEITRSFKIMAKELDIPIVLLSQLSRSSEKQSRRPMLSDLRDSGSIEQDADIVLFLHRDVSSDETSENQSNANEVILMVAKNRHGEVTNIRLHWDGAHTRFTSMDYERNE